jgi:DNA repair protein RadD
VYEVEASPIDVGRALVTAPPGTIVLRPYQTNAVEVIVAHLCAGGGPALIEMATATGKSLVIATAVRRMLMVSTAQRAIIAVHVQELVEQNVKALLAVWPEAPYGICCAGLGRRDHDAPIIFGTIQSLARDAEKLGWRDLVIVDECQMLSRNEDSQYLSLLGVLRSRAPDLHLVGLSATCFRLDSGYLHKGEGALFEKIVFSYGIAQGIKDGYLSPLRSKGTRTRIDVRGVHIRGGEFIQNELERAANIAEVVEGAVAEIVERGNNSTRADGDHADGDQPRRHCWIAFCVSIEHAYAVRDAIRRHGIICETVTSETPADERRAIFAAFRNGSIRCLIGVNIFSVGFDIPQVDLIALLRPTLSTGLYIQMVGRASRLAPGKNDAVILDFACNVRRHGPVDDPQINVTHRTPVAANTVATITCPKCQEENSKSARACVCCGHVFVSEIKIYEPHTRQAHHSATANDAPILSTPTTPTWIPVFGDPEFKLHQKRHDPNAPPTLRVEYMAGFSPYSEYISFESLNGYARSFAQRWWIAMGGLSPVPVSVIEAIMRRSELGRVTEIQVEREGQYWRISRRRVLRNEGTLVEIDSKYHVTTSAVTASAVTSQITSSEITSPLQNSSETAPLEAPEAAATSEVAA